MGFSNFNYEEEEEERVFKPLPVGDYRIRIAEAEKMQSSTGKDMLRLVFEVSNSKAKIFHYIVDGDYFNANISRLFDSFPQIKKGDFNLAGWIGKIGACHTKQEKYNGNINAKVHYFISANKQEHLPAWIEPENATGEIKPQERNSDFVNIAEGSIEEMELPFE